MDPFTLYELIRTRATQLETTWRAHQKVNACHVLVSHIPQENDSIPLQSVTTNGLASPGRNRRIKPTQLSTVATLSPLNPSFIPENSVSNAPNLNRPLQMTAAWKKIAPAQVQPIKITPPESTLKSRLQNALRSSQLDELALAGHEMLFSACLDEANRFQLSFSSALSALLKILSLGHEILHAKDDESSWDYMNNQIWMNESGSNQVNNRECGLSHNQVNNRESGEYYNQVNNSLHLPSPLSVILLAGSIIKLSSVSLSLLFPDSIRFLARNAVIEVLGISFPSHLLAKSTSITNTILPNQGPRDNDPLAVAYSNTRDSRNFFTDPTAHANQQRIRDLFLNLIRHYSGLDCGQASFRRGFGGRVSEIVGRLMSDSSSNSHSWLADLFLTEYMQSAESRIDSLEERLGKRKREIRKEDTNTIVCMLVL